MSGAGSVGRPAAAAGAGGSDRAGAGGSHPGADPAGRGGPRPGADPAGAVFGALADPTRRALLATIADNPQITATELASALPISRQAVLKHLAALADAGLLDRERSGREVHYRMTPEPLSDAVSWMAEVGSQWDSRLAGLSRQLRTRA
jgi:DNA-binding transcriptional ArsR family regulator